MLLHTAFSPWARPPNKPMPHDRVRHLAEERLKRQRKALAQTQLPGAGGLPEIAPILRGAVAMEKTPMPALPNGRSWISVATGRFSDYVNGAERCPLQPSRCGHARPHDPHQELAAAGAGAGGGQAGRMGRDVEGGGRGICRRTITPISPATTKSRPTRRRNSIHCRASSWCRAGAVRRRRRAKDAAIAADIAENTVQVITDAEAIGEYKCICEYDMFEVEYWSLEQAKLGKSAEKALARQVAVVTGGGSGIGAATAMRWQSRARKLPSWIAILRPQKPWQRKSAAGRWRFGVT